MIFFQITLFKFSTPNEKKKKCGQYWTKYAKSKNNIIGIVNMTE